LGPQRNSQNAGASPSHVHISGSTIGSVAFGPGAQATGVVNLGVSGVAQSLNALPMASSPSSGTSSSSPEKRSEATVPTGELVRAQATDPANEPLARLRLAQKRLGEHPDKTCPSCRKTTLSSQDDYQDALDRVTRTWTCASCKYTNSAVGVPISEWPSDQQNVWCSKAAEQRARKQIIRCPTCGNESIDAKESGVVGIGTSEHVLLSCKTSGCIFKEREVERSVIGTGKNLLRKGVLLVLVAAGLVLAGWALRQALTFPTPAPFPQLVVVDGGVDSGHIIKFMGQLLYNGRYVAGATIYLVGAPACRNMSGFDGTFNIDLSGGCVPDAPVVLEDPRVRILLPGREALCAGTVSLRAERIMEIVVQDTADGCRISGNPASLPMPLPSPTTPPSVTPVPDVTAPPDPQQRPREGQVVQDGGDSTYREGNTLDAGSHQADAGRSDCGPPPPFDRGAAQLRIGTATEPLVVDQRLSELRSLLRDKGGDSWRGRFDTVPGTDGRRPIRVIITNDVKPDAGRALCGWLACMGWKPGRFACDVR
jgi:hypothetical protein